MEELADGTVVANLESKKRISGDALLFAVGRQGAVDDLNLAAAGLEADNRAASRSTSTTRPRSSTSSPSATWWASPRWPRFQWSSDALPRRGPSTIAPRLPTRASIPTCIYTIPEISFIGKTEEQLTDEDVPYEVGMAYYRENRARADSRRHLRAGSS